MSSKALSLAGLLFATAMVTAGCEPAGSSVRLAVMADVDTSAMITLQEAVAIALDRVEGGFAVAAGLEVEDDDEVEPAAYEVVVFVPADQQMMEVEVDAYSGDVLEVEVEEDGDSED